MRYLENFEISPNFTPVFFQNLKLRAFTWRENVPSCKINKNHLISNKLYTQHRNDICLGLKLKNCQNGQKISIIGPITQIGDFSLILAIILNNLNKIRKYFVYTHLTQQMNGFNPLYYEKLKLNFFS